MRWFILSMVLLSVVVSGHARPDIARAQSPEPVHEVTITIRPDGMTAEPDLWDSRDRRLTAPVTATWINLDSEAHFIRADRTGGPVVGLLEPGQTKTTTVTEVDKYGCDYHPADRLVILAVDNPDRAPVPPPSRLNVLVPRAGYSVVEVNGVENGPVHPLIVARAGARDGGEREVLAVFDPLVSTRATTSRPLHAGETVSFALYNDANANGALDGVEVDTPAVQGPSNKPVEIFTEVVPAFPLRAHDMEIYATGEFMLLTGGGAEPVEFDFAAAFARPPARPLSEQLLIAFGPLAAFFAVALLAFAATRKRS